MTKVLILGSTGGIGSAIVDTLYGGCLVICPTKQSLDLEGDSGDAISNYLFQTNPDVIINAAGTFGDNSVSFNKIFDVNVKANWSILQHYIDNPPEKIVKFVMIGSSAYTAGRKNYVLYAASKAALHNLFQGASELFAGTNLLLGLVHPRKTDTKMLDPLGDIDRSDCLSPKDVAKKVVDFVVGMQTSTYININ